MTKVDELTKLANKFSEELIKFGVKNSVEKRTINLGGYNQEIKFCESEDFKTILSCRLESLSAKEIQVLQDAAKDKMGCVSVTFSPNYEYCFSHSSLLFIEKQINLFCEKYGLYKRYAWGEYTSSRCDYYTDVIFDEQGKVIFADLSYCGTYYQGQCSKEEEIEFIFDSWDFEIRDGMEYEGYYSRMFFTMPRDEDDLWSNLRKKSHDYNEIVE